MILQRKYVAAEFERSGAETMCSCAVLEWKVSCTLSGSNP